MVIGSHKQLYIIKKSVKNDEFHELNIQSYLLS